MLETSFRLLRYYGACKGRYRHLRKSLGPGYGDDTPIGLDRILEINGLEDAVWALRAVHPEQVQERDRLARLFACRCLRETPTVGGHTVWDLLLNERSREAVVVAERYARGKASEGELAAARDAAWEAAREAAWEAAREAAWDVAREAAWEATRMAAWDVAARDAAWEAAREAQEKMLSDMLNS